MIIFWIVALEVASSLPTDYRIATQENRVIYPSVAHAQQSYCQKCASVFQMSDNSVVQINSQSYFTVTVDDDSAEVEVKGISMSILSSPNNYQSYLSIQAECISYQSTSFTFNTIFLLKTWQAKQGDFEQQHQDTIAINTILYCVSKNQISAIQNFINCLYLLIWLVLNLTIATPPNNLTLSSKISFIAINLILVYNRDDMIIGFAGYEIFLWIVYALLYRNQKISLWLVIILLRTLNNMLFISFPALYESISNATIIQVTTILMSMVRVVRLRDLVLWMVVVWSAICLTNNSDLQYITNIVQKATVLTLPTPFYGCTSSNLLLAMLSIPTIRYMKQIQNEYYTLSSLILATAIIPISISHRYWVIGGLLMFWLLIQIAKKGPHQVITFRLPQ